MITLKRVEKICSHFKDKNILVFGDVILDRYIFGEVSRISPEAPVPVVKVSHEEYRPGGAGNVAANIDGLGARGILLGITGDDIFSREIDRLKTKDNFVIKSGQNKTLVKTRVIAQRQQIVRIDREEKIAVTPAGEAGIAAAAGRIKKGKIHGIIVSDYAKGTLTRGTMDMLIAEAAALDIPLIVDPKPPNFDLYKNSGAITPNLKEAGSLLNKKIKNDADAAEAVKYINKRFNTRFSIITRGAEGISAGEKGKRVFHLPAYSHEVFDVTGAGDTVVSVLLLSLVCGATLKEAVSLANGAASIVIEKIGASITSGEEIYHRMKFLLSRRGGTASPAYKRLRRKGSV
ncbi:MAG: bifunctional hydroxymethylpyrimidine kinase/phosphomethylpyrimidine kinase [Candidatus Aminicenantes bacterium]|nr:bifunctional hydroxymethylpyrimidine kinase/phosphomethylpyrimidine kinase [Candidatus Aminicenantes bacterium]